MAGRSASCSTGRLQGGACACSVRGRRGTPHRRCARPRQLRRHAAPAPTLQHPHAAHGRRGPRAPRVLALPGWVDRGGCWAHAEREPTAPMGRVELGPWGQGGGAVLGGVPQRAPSHPPSPPTPHPPTPLPPLCSWWRGLRRAATPTWRPCTKKVGTRGLAGHCWRGALRPARPGPGLAPPTLRLPCPLRPA